MQVIWWMLDTRHINRQTNILLTDRKVITDLFFIEMRELYVHVYTKLLIS